ncbi:MAG: hypothetical protein ABSE95_00190 [Thermodesulfobacteriota bacterium]|jgi:hypothetical protein
MAQDLLPGKLGVASGLMIGFAIGTGGLGVTLLDLVADKWGVPTTLQTMTVMPITVFLLCLLFPAASFHPFGSSLRINKILLFRVSGDIRPLMRLSSRFH